MRFFFKSEKESSASPFLDSDVSSTDLGFALGGLIQSFSTNYMFGYSTKTYDNSVALNETLIQINCSWNM